MQSKARRRPPAQLGRKRNPALDAAILDAALDILAEVGFAGMTMDMTAKKARVGKAAIYRRWPSKIELVIDALAWMTQQEVAGIVPPDTGSFRNDMVALMQPEAFANGERRLRIMSGLASIPADRQALVAATSAASMDAWVRLNRQLIERAIERGEFGANARLDTLSALIPSMCTFRVSLLRLPITPAFLLDLIDGVLLPALRGYSAQ